jgi:hypothetical protein
MTYRKIYSFTDMWKKTLQVIGINTLLAFFLCACGSASFSTTTTSPDTMWTKTESPLFPANWPPISETVWVRYTFAYGKNPALLMDGNYVTSPLSKTEWQAGNTSTIILSDEMTEAAIQGMIPLDDEAIAILENEKQVSEYCLTMSGMPNLDTSETKEMLAYYAAWFKYNSAFLDLIRGDHAEFIDWVEINQ